MNFNTKANNMFKIIGRSPYMYDHKFNTWEVLDTTDDRNKAYRLLSEYRLSFGNKWGLEIVEE